MPRPRFPNAWPCCSTPRAEESYSQYDLAVAQDRITITIDPEVLEELRARVPHGELSAYVVEALRRRLQRDPVMDMLDELDQRFGPTADDSQREAKQWLDDLTNDWPT